VNDWSILLIIYNYLIANQYFKALNEKGETDSGAYCPSYNQQIQRLSHTFFDQPTNHNP
jgi:hypothetical protein